jgi:hypothetical protein
MRRISRIISVAMTALKKKAKKL